MLKASRNPLLEDYTKSLQKTIVFHSLLHYIVCYNNNHWYGNNIKLDNVYNMCRKDIALCSGVARLTPHTLYVK